MKTCASALFRCISPRTGKVNIEWRHSREPGKPGAVIIRSHPAAGSLFVWISLRRGCPVVVDGPMPAAYELV